MAFTRTRNRIQGKNTESAPNLTAVRLVCQPKLTCAVPPTSAQAYTAVRPSPLTVCANLSLHRPGRTLVFTYTHTVVFVFFLLLKGYGSLHPVPVGFSQAHTGSCMQLVTFTLARFHCNVRSFHHQTSDSLSMYPAWDPCWSCYRCFFLFCIICFSQTHAHAM